MRRAFTVVELLVAVVVLLAVIIATSKIFNTASKVSSTGEANADVLQQGTIIEEQLRRDLERISRDGYMAIHCTVVANNINQLISGSDAPLLDPQLKPTDVLRCDQLVFFTAGTNTSSRWAGPGDLINGGGGQQSQATRVYYGHGVQFPDLPNDPANNPPVPNSPIKPIITGVTPAPPSGFPPQIAPWTWFKATGYRLGWKYAGFTETSGPRVLANQPEARQWVLARKAALLVDDGGRPIYYPEPELLWIATGQGASSATSIFGDRSNTGGSGSDPAYYQELKDRNYIPSSGSSAAFPMLIPSPSMQSGWVDVAASDLGRVRRLIAPTLRLSSAFQLGGRDYLSTLSPPFAMPPSVGGAPQAPLSWPTGVNWPGGTPVNPVGLNMPAVSFSGYSTQRDRIMRGTFGVPSSSGIPPGYGLLGWPRSEKGIGNTDRKSEMLMSPTLVTNCSSFQVDWTWTQGTGRQVDASGQLLQACHDGSVGFPAFLQQQLVSRLKINGDAVTYDQKRKLRGFEPFADVWPAAKEPTERVRPQPWFGFPDNYSDTLVTGSNPEFKIPDWQRLGVRLAQDPTVMPAIDYQGTEFVDQTNLQMRAIARQIEGWQIPLPNNTSPGAVMAPYGPSVPIRTYTAVFGFNQDEAYTVTPDGFVVARDDYTPWPTQIRVTCTIHDPRLVLDRGREFQFVLDVPKRRKD
jgi:competence protein ComGC